MNIRSHVRHVLLAASLLTGSLAYGSDLAEVYQHALRNDPQIREAEANRLASLESKPQALSALLPQISADAYYQDSESDGTRTITSLAGGQLVQRSVDYENDAETTNWSLGLRQNIFRWQNWVALKQADAEVAQAESDYRAAEQDLVQRTAERYFNVLAARDTLVAAQATYEALGRQLEQAEKRFEVGLIAVTDVQESKAAYDSATAAVIAAKRALATQQEQLRELTGQTFDELTRPGDKMPLGLPDPPNQEAWVKLAMEQNARLISARLATDITREQISAEQGGHLPTVDFVASRSGNDLNSSGLFDTQLLPSDTTSDDTVWSVQFSLPIYSGGYTSSRVRQAEYRHRASRERLESTSRQTERSTRDSYLGVMAEQARVKALKQAVESAKTALQATEAGFEVGTRTTVDVLDGRRRLFDAETNYARSRYDYIINIIKLRLAAGTLDAKSIAEVNGWLEESVSVKY